MKDRFQRRPAPRRSTSARRKPCGCTVRYADCDLRGLSPCRCACHDAERQTNLFSDAPREEQP